MISLSSKNIPCVFLTNGKHSLQSETTLKGFPIHSECINNIQIKPLPQTKPFTLTQQNTFYFIKFSLMSLDQKKSLFKSFLRKLTKKPLTKRDTSNDLDWFKTFPITEEIEQHTQLNTQVSIKLFNFLKSNLINFTPGKILKQASGDIPASKSSFKYLIKSIAG